MTKIRGFLGEQSFEITDGAEIVERLCEAQIFSSAYRTAVDKGQLHSYSLVHAREAVSSFRQTRQ